MRTLAELGQAVARSRRERGLTQAMLAAQAGLSRETLARFERGQLSEFGSRKLLALLAVLEAELSFTVTGSSGSLDELRRERGGS